jgi:hypothetical protein
VVIAIVLRPPFILSFERIPDRQCTKSSKQFKGLGANSSPRQTGLPTDEVHRMTARFELASRRTKMESRTDGTPDNLRQRAATWAQQGPWFRGGTLGDTFLQHRTRKADPRPGTP